MEVVEMKAIAVNEDARDAIRYNLIQEAVRHIQERGVYQARICELVKDRETNQREISEYGEKVIEAQSAFRAVSGVAVHCFGFSVVDFENQAYAAYQRYQGQ